MNHSKRTRRTVPAFLLASAVALAGTPADCGPGAHQPAGKAGQASAPNPATAAPASWKAPLAKGKAALAAGNLAEADSHLQSAVATAENAHDKGGTLECLNAWADCLAEEHNFGEEEQARKRALSLASETSGAESPEAAVQMAGIASMLARKGEVGGARAQVDQAMDLLGRAGGSHPLEMSACYLALGRTQVAEGVPGLADDSFKKALELQESKLGPKHEQVLATCKEYALLLEQLDRKPEAAKLRERITLAQALATTTGASSPPGKKGESPFDKFVQSARAAEGKGDREAAIANWKLAVAEGEKKGSADGRLAFALVHLGDQYNYKQQTDEAKALYKRALSVREDASQTATLGMARNLTRLANMAMSKRDFAEAERNLARAVEVEDQCGASDLIVATTLQSLASSCMMTKNFSKAEQVCRRLISLADKSSGPAAAMKKMQATSLLGGICMQTGRMNEGMALMKQATSSLPQGAVAEYSKTVQGDFAAIEKQIDENEEAAFSK